MNENPETQNRVLVASLAVDACSAPLKYECDDLNVICPHCGASYQPESEDFSEEMRVEECCSCGKSYEVWQNFSITHHTCTQVSPN
mgnify:CR=1 FL=1